MCTIARRLLAEKLIDDFYEWSVQGGREKREEAQSMQDLTGRLKNVLPIEQHEWLYRWEAACSETCSQELRQFADYVAEILVMIEPLQETCE